MPVHVHVRLPADNDRKGKHHGEDGNKERPGWAKSREKLGNEPPAKSLSVGIGQWIARASKHSGPQYAPGVGVRKSS